MGESKVGKSLLKHGGRGSKHYNTNKTIDK